jgi:hypothetical protein
MNLAIQAADSTPGEPRYIYIYIYISSAQGMATCGPRTFVRPYVETIRSKNTFKLNGYYENLIRNLLRSYQHRIKALSTLYQNLITTLSKGDAGRAPKSFCWSEDLWFFGLGTPGLQKRLGQQNTSGSPSVSSCTTCKISP